MKGSVTYNGHSLQEFVPQKTSAYISQYDLHIAELTVRETLDFSAQCQGVGSKYGTLNPFLVNSRYTIAHKIEDQKHSNLDIFYDVLLQPQKAENDFDLII
jgi:ABC-type multidrug transport system ATPase subunit